MEKSGGAGGGVLYPGVHGQVPTVRAVHLGSGEGGGEGWRM